MQGEQNLILVSKKKFNEINNMEKSEIPCRVSNIAQDSGDTIPMTGSNRWNPNDVCASASKGNTEGKIRGKRERAASFPRNDLRVEILRWSR